MRVRLPALLGAALVVAAGLARAGDPLDMATVKVKAPKEIKDWQGEYNKPTESWTYEKYAEVKGEDTRKPNRFYVDLLPEDAPKKAKEYAEKLKTKDFQDISYVYTEITEANDLPDGGFLIKGMVIDHGDKEAKAEVGFVYVKKIAGTLVRAKSATLVNDEMRKEAIELAKTLANN